MDNNPNLPPNVSQEDCDGEEFGQYYVESSIAFWCDSLEDRDKIMSAIDNAIGTYNGETDYVEIDHTIEPE